MVSACSSILSASFAVSASYAVGEKGDAVDDLINGAAAFLNTRVFDTDVKTIAIKVLIFVTVFLVAYVLQRIASRLTRKALKNMEDIPSATLIVGIVRAVIWVIAFLCVLDPVFGINPTGLVAGLGVGSLILSLGMKDSISNVFSGIILMATRTLVPGDYITIAGITGTVVDVTMRHTVVVDRDNEHVVIPNSLLDTSSLTKIPVDVESMGVIPFTMAPGNDPNKVAADLVQTVTQAGAAYLRTDLPPSVLYSTFTPFGLEGEVDFYVKPNIPLENVADVLARSLAGKAYFAFVARDSSPAEIAAAQTVEKRITDAAVPPPAPSEFVEPPRTPGGASDVTSNMGPAGASDATPAIPAK